MPRRCRRSLRCGDEGGCRQGDGPAASRRCASGRHEIRRGASRVRQGRAHHAAEQRCTSGARQRPCASRPEGPIARLFRRGRAPRRRSGGGPPRQVHCAGHAGIAGPRRWKRARELVALAPTDAAAQNAWPRPDERRAFPRRRSPVSRRRCSTAGTIRWSNGTSVTCCCCTAGSLRDSGITRRGAGRKGPRWTRLDGPEWRRGLSLPGKRLLLYAEQAFGDTIHFARYAGVFADMGATVIFGVYAPLAVLMAQARGVAEVTLADERTPPYDLHLPLMSAPYVLGEDEADIQGRPYIVADQQRIAGWAGRLPAGRPTGRHRLAGQQVDSREGGAAGGLCAARCDPRRQPDQPAEDRRLRPDGDPAGRSANRNAGSRLRSWRRRVPRYGRGDDEPRPDRLGRYPRSHIWPARSGAPSGSC